MGSSVFGNAEASLSRRTCFRAYLSLCPDQHAGSLLAFNTQTRAERNDPSNRDSPESRIALAAGRLCAALAR